jgi:ABC-2 type transport system ATP-binding protein
VSHDLHSVRRFCNRAILIHDGHLVEDGPPSAVISRYEELMAQMAGLALHQA